MSSLFGTSIRLQLAAVCFIGLVIFDFMKAKRIKLLTTRIFSILLWTSAVYMLLDIATIYTLTNLPGTLINEIVHRLFYFAMISVVMCVSTYVEFAGNIKTAKIKLLPTLFWIVPYVVCAVGIFTQNLTYIRNSHGMYSTGTATNFLYGGIAFYIIVTFIETFRYREALSAKKRFALRLQLIIWAITAIIQFINPYMLLSALAISLTVTALYFSFENQNENLDESTGAFNSRAFAQVFYEKSNCLGKKSFRLAAIVIDDADIIISSVGYHLYESIMVKAAREIGATFDVPVYRIKTNIFAVLYPDNTDDFEQKLKKIERKMSFPFKSGEASIRLSTHAVTLKCPEIASEPSDVYELVSVGSEYSGSGYVRVVDNEILERKKRNDILSKMLIDAIRNDGFEVVYQPIYSAEKKEFISAEALVRLKDTKTLGFVSPEEFIPLAEKNGYIIEIGQIVFEKVCDTIRFIKERDMPLDYIEVNLSALQSIDEEVPRVFAKIMRRYEIEPASVNLEITETTAVESAALLEKNMSRFRTMGCSFSMDDFGTGYSNLSKMAEINYDLVKLDKSLIWPAFGENKSEKAEYMLKACVDMIRFLGAHIVAEGVETGEMADKLAEMGVHYMQGYYYSKPISREAFIEFIRRNAKSVKETV